MDYEWNSFSKHQKTSNKYQTIPNVQNIKYQNLKNIMNNLLMI